MAAVVEHGAQHVGVAGRALGSEILCDDQRPDLRPAMGARTWASLIRCYALDTKSINLAVIYC